MSAPQIRAHVGHAMCAAAEYDTDVVRYQRTPYVVRRARERTGGLVKSSWVACRVPVACRCRAVAPGPAVQ